MMEQITLEQFRRTVRIRLRLLRVFILLCAAAVFCAHFWGHRGGVPGAGHSVCQNHPQLGTGNQSVFP